MLWWFLFTFYFKTHAARTGHQNFAESTEEIKPLTEEEKKQQRERLATVVVIFFYLEYFEVCKNFMCMII